ncbi:hypothetical protein P170DRAFT_441019 [Aspergillus steynii IBT 23096]|uniref:Regulator of phospholipase D SRF1 n=1 Tax=Aspergillus steynii IBT 23096 TaxID=1392250 RepID=A0A2I2FSH2_9EURO|nr:uncharacterized protein P170DRAFT_441019 [Aspergillus steynii IBT 23096]PLB43556.1 hypothetical protein P170DRAFT_441019 [Aspergillus steynii IBT 23096]
MAQDVDHSLLQSPGSQPSLDNRPSEIPSPAKWTSGPSTLAPNGQYGDRQPLEPFPNGTMDQVSTMSYIPEESEMENGVVSPPQQKKSRTLPAWIRSVEDLEDEPEATATSRLLPANPDEAVVAQHNHSPHATRRPDPPYADRGSLEDGRAISPRRESRWKNFSKEIAYPREPGVEEKAVTPEWLNENHGDYSQPWRGQRASWECEDTEDPLRKKRRREIWFKRFHNTLLKSPIVPLIFRLTVWCFSLTALALGGSIQHLSQEYVHPQGPSALMAIIVDAVALVYLIYITWDEYTSKPLGLRSPSAKARLVLLDIFFIVFDSANLSLAFESLSTISGACTVGEINQEITPKNDRICDRQIALASVLLIALLAWLTTFAISVLRLVERAAN